jgi:hypothetical protein
MKIYYIEATKWEEKSKRRSMRPDPYFTRERAEEMIVRYEGSEGENGVFEKGYFEIVEEDTDTIPRQRICSHFQGAWYWLMGGRDYIRTVRDVRVERNGIVGFARISGRDVPVRYSVGTLWMAYETGEEIEKYRKRAGTEIEIPDVIRSIRLMSSGTLASVLREQGIEIGTYNEADEWEQRFVNWTESAIVDGTIDPSCSWITAWRGFAETINGEGVIA